jgi:ribonuclease HI
VALIQIRARRPARYLTDSMSSIKTLQAQTVAPRTHSLENNGYEIHMMWIPSHVGVRGNKRADQLACG